jgi:hypothetical protein
VNPGLRGERPPTNRWSMERVNCLVILGCVPLTAHILYSWRNFRIRFNWLVLCLTETCEHCAKTTGYLDFVPDSLLNLYNTYTCSILDSCFETPRYAGNVGEEFEEYTLRTWTCLNWLSRISGEGIFEHHKEKPDYIKQGTDVRFLRKHNLYAIISSIRKLVINSNVNNKFSVLVYETDTTIENSIWIICIT